MDFANLRNGAGDDDEGDEIELVFDDADLAAFMAPAPALAVAPPPEAPPEAAAEPAVEADAKPAKKRPAKGKALPAPPPEPEFAPPAPVAEQVPAAVIAPAAAPAATAPAPRLVTVAVMIAAFASVVSGVGVVFTAHNIARLADAQADVSARQALLARLPAIIASIEHLRDAQRVELARIAAINGAAPVTLPDLRRELDNTRLALGRSQPAGIGPLGGVVRAGQTELVTRLQELSEDVKKLGKR